MAWHRTGDKPLPGLMPLPCGCKFEHTLWTNTISDYVRELPLIFMPMSWKFYLSVGYLWRNFSLIRVLTIVSLTPCAILVVTFSHHYKIVFVSSTAPSTIALDPCLIYDTDRYGWIWGSLCACATARRHCRRLQPIAIGYSRPSSWPERSHAGIQGDKDIRLWLFRPWPSKYLNQ